MKLLEQQEKFIVALEGDSAEHARQIIAEHNSKDAEAQTKELLQTMPQKQRLRLCKAILRQVRQGATMLEDRQDPGQQDESETGGQDVGAELLRNLSLLLALMLNGNAKAVSENMQHAAVILHDSALLAAAEWPGLQDAVASLCTAWWQAGAAGKEALIAQTLPYLLVRALSTNRSADVKRCYVMRHALSLLDFEDESIGDLKRLLLRAAFSPAFLRSKEGRRYLAHLFTLEPQMVRELGAIVRNQIPSGRKSVLDSYGEILYRAWRDSTAASLLEVENLVQGMMEAAIGASTQPMAAALRRVLDGFHREKAAPGVDALLLRLYRPILFRALAAANPAVRGNALGLLLDAFPLQDPAASNEETDELLSKQFAQLGDALGDVAPAVRAAAVSGVCQLLNTFWELIPSAVTAGFLKRIAGELAFDGACVAVRVAAVTGLALLAQNPLTQPLMKVMLPTLRPLMWDSAPAVRIALADMLVAIGSMRNLSFVDVVPLDTLLDVLASDSLPVAERVHCLLVPSYFPGPEDGPACVAALLRQSPEAGKAFCRQLVDSDGACVPVEHIVALVVALRDHLLACAPAAAAAAADGAALRADTAGRKGKRKKKGAAQPQQVDGQAAETPEAWEAMLEGLACLCEGLGHCKLESDQGSSPMLFTGGQLVSLLGMAATPAARSAVLSIAGAFPDSAAGGNFQSRCLSQLLTSSSGPPSQAELRSALHCLAGTDDMEALMDHIISALDSQRPPSARSRALPSLRMSPDSALRCLDAMLADEALRLALLSSQSVTDLLPVLQRLARNSAQYLRAQISASFLGCSAPEQAGLDDLAGGDSDASLAFPSASIYCKAALHLQLTTALVSAATQTQMCDSGAAQPMSDVDGVSTAEGGNGSTAGSKAPAHMWQSVGDAAVREVLADATQLLSCLQAIGAANLTGELSGEPGHPTRPPKRGRKGRAAPSDAVGSSLDRLALLSAANQSLLGAAALAADAARLVRWESAGGETADAACALAADLVQWTSEAAAAAAGGVEVDWAAAAAAALGHAAKLAHQLLSAHKPGSTAARPEQQASTLCLATRLMQAGAGSKESWPTAALRPFLSGIVAGLCRQSATPQDCSWVSPIAATLGEEVMEASAADGAAQDEGAKSRKKTSTTTSANAENVPQNKQAAGPGRQMTAFKPSHPFLKAVLQAVNFAKVQPEMALCAAKTATLQSDAWQACLGAVQLTCLAGFKGPASGGNKEYAEVRSILEGMHGMLGTEESNLEERSAEAKEVLQTVLDTLVPSS